MPDEIASTEDASIENSPISTEASELVAVVEKVQVLLDNAKKTLSYAPNKTTTAMLMAESLLEKFLVEHPDNIDAKKVLSDVQSAHRESNSTIQLNRDRAAEKQLRTTRSYQRDNGSSNTAVKLIAWMVSIGVVVWLAYMFIPGINHAMDCMTAEPVEKLFLGCDS
jgi:hypothetical protein